jgi:hypothetical protein
VSRKAPLRQRQAQRRAEFHQARITAARTPEEQYAAAYAWHLAEVRNLGPAERPREMWEAAQILVDRAVELVRRTGK